MSCLPPQRNIDFLSRFVSKRVGFRFAGHELEFLLSHSLFSSYDIDRGTKLLIRTVAREIQLSPTAAILDVGCGAGILGACLKKANADRNVILQDRDALACEFTKANLALNRLEGSVLGGLALEGMTDRLFDLVISNLPAKAGQPVLRDFFARVPALLTEKGVAACALVSPLEGFAREAILAAGSPLLLTQTTKTHAILFFGKAELRPSADLFKVYIRGSHAFQACDIGYSLTTVHGLPDFDTISYQCALAQEATRGLAVADRWLCWNPGQGHLPVYLASWNKHAGLALASRDILSLKISALNLRQQGMEITDEDLLHVASLDHVSGAYDFVALLPTGDAHAWQGALLEQCAELLEPKGRALVSAKSSDVYRILAANRSFTVEHDRKYRGLRCVLLRRKR